MRLPRPKSLNSLLLTGFALVSIPLLVAVVIAATKVRALSEESAALVRTGVEATHYTQLLFQQIAPLERSVRLYQVLKDAELLSAYRDSRERVLDTLKRMRPVVGDPERARQLDALHASLDQIDAALLSPTPPSGAALQDAVDSINPMWRAANLLSSATADQIETG